MKKSFKIILLLLVILIVAIGLVFAFLKMSKERALELQSEKPVVAESRLKKNEKGETGIVLDDETQKRIALQAAPVAVTTFQPEIKGYGKVLDPAPLALAISEIASAQIAASASRQESNRLKTLGENTAAKNLQAAEAIARHDELTLDAAKLRLKISWGKAFAEKTNLTELLDSLASAEAALVRIEVPVGELSSAPLSARLISLGTETNFVEAEFLDAASSVEPQTQNRGFIFIAKENRQRLVPGTAVTGFLKVSGEPMRGVIIPRSAIVRLNGKLWFYAQTEKNFFVRREISADDPVETGFFTATLTEAIPVVIRGAQTLLSEEQKDQIQMGD